MYSYFNNFNNFNNEKRKLIAYKNAKYNMEKSLTKFPRNLDDVQQSQGQMVVNKYIKNVRDSIKNYYILMFLLFCGLIPIRTYTIHVFNTSLHIPWWVPQLCGMTTISMPSSFLLKSFQDHSWKLERWRTMT